MKKKWVVPTVITVVVLAILGVIAKKAYDLMFGGTLTMSWDDIVLAIYACRYPLILGGILIVAAIVLAIVAKVNKTPAKGAISLQAPVALILAVAMMVSWICLDVEYGVINAVLKGEPNVTEETMADSLEIAEQIADEGIVLLKNEGNALPLAGVTKLNVFGWSSTAPIYGGTGSGATSEELNVTLLQGLENAGFEVNSELVEFYKAYRQGRPVGALRLRDIGKSKGDWTIPEPTIAEYEAAGIFESAKEFSDTALVIISRTGGEGCDTPASLTAEGEVNRQYGDWGPHYTFSIYEDDLDAGKSYLELSNREIAMLDRVNADYENVIVIVNSSNAMELGFLDQYENIKGAVLCAGPGQVGFNSLGNVLNGTVNPSGHLADTYVYDLLTTPTIDNHGSFRYDNYADVTGDEANVARFVNYVEGIYVGYKFYETAAEEGLINYEEIVQFPFGYGLSYTDFETEITDVQDDGANITLSVTVTNTGAVAGKGVAQIYFTPPYYNGGIEKASVNLVNFAKTQTLEPGASEILTIPVSYEEMASYDSDCIKSSNGAYVLEAGNYTLSVRSDAHTVLDTYDFVVETDVIYDDEHDGKRSSDAVTATNQFGFARDNGFTYLSRKDSFANYAEAVALPTNYSMTQEQKDRYTSKATFNAADYDDPDAVMPTTGADNGLTIQDMVGVDYNDAKWNQLIEQMSVQELFNLVIDGGYHTYATESINLADDEDCDGPTGLHSNYHGGAGAAYPVSVVIACTWNKDLAYARGTQIGHEARELEASGWYGPAMNIHRSAFSGRNFEYYSECGVLSGIIGAQEVKGATEQGVVVFMKHFALNDQDTYRECNLSTWSTEQAIREIYLKPFEMSVKVGGALGAMSSMNAIGTEWAGSCEALLTTVLRGEWGFQGNVITDAIVARWYMDPDRAIRTGGNKMLAFNVTPEMVSGQDTAGTVIALQEAAHGLLYSLANSNAMERNVGTPTWVMVIYALDAVAVIGIVLLELAAAKRYKKAKAEAQQA